MSTQAANMPEGTAKALKEPFSVIVPEDPSVATLTTTVLPRGGVIVSTKIGNVQVGMPPETVKDAMLLGLEVPTYYVVPSDPFNITWGPNMGINVAEFEFPAYCNFFLKRKSVNLIVESKEVEQRIRQVFQETLFGPKEINIREDYPIHTPDNELPMLEKELLYFRKFGENLIELDMLLTFTHYDVNGFANITDSHGNTVQIEKLEQCFLIKDDSGQATIMDFVQLPPPPQEIPLESEMFRPPIFGVTVLGNSHGFDPSGKTSGYVLWINRRGIMIDPPPYSSSILLANHIPSILIDGVIVTHCHADHDGGTFQKILQEGRVTMITTGTIYNSFIRKYSALSGLEENQLHNVLNFRPVRINDPMTIRGAVFNFFYSLHSIPCVGFEVEFSGKRIVFSGDHLNDPPKIEELFQNGVLNEYRKQQLLNFPWDCDLILHEAGVPPIHTPLKTLEQLPEDVRDRLYVVHTAERDIPRGVGLKIAPEGVQNTLVVSAESNTDVTALEILDLVRRIDMFSDLKLDHAHEILHMLHHRKFSPQEVIVKKGSVGNKFYIIMGGAAEVIIPHGEDINGKPVTLVKKFVAGDYFGEHALISSAGLRTADVVASTELSVIEFDGVDFHWLLHDTNVKDKVVQLAEARGYFVWEIMRINSLLSRLSSKQKTRLEGMFRRVEFVKGGEVWKAGAEVEMAVLVENGEFTANEIKKAGTSVIQRRRSAVRVNPINPDSSYSKGAFIGEFDSIMSQDLTKYTTTLVCDIPGSVFVISKQDLRNFLRGNPGVFLSLRGKRSLK